MAETTANYGLTKPTYDDEPDIAVISADLDIIDARMKAIADAAGNATGAGAQYVTESEMWDYVAQEIQAWDEGTANGSY